MLNLHSMYFKYLTVCQLYLNKVGGKKKKIKEYNPNSYQSLQGLQRFGFPQPLPLCSLAKLWPQGPPFLPLSPWKLCICCSLCLSTFLPDLYMSVSFSLLRSSLKCFPIRLFLRLPSLTSPPLPCRPTSIPSRS